MAEKRYHNDWAKAKSRDLVKAMISRTLLKFRKPKELAVLCFPGIDCEEIFQVYDPLGIPRSNIVGVEREKKIADDIEKKNLGIRLVRGSLDEFVRQQCLNGGAAFDVVSLDYTNPITRGQLDLLSIIAFKQRRNHFLLHSTNLLKREKSPYLYCIGYGLGDSHVIALDSNLKEIFKIVDRTTEFVKKYETNGGVLREKQQGYSNLLESAFLMSDKLIRNGLFKFIFGPAYEAELRLCEQALSSFFGSEFRINREDPFGTELHEQENLYRQYFTEILNHMIERGLEENCVQQGIQNESMQIGIRFALNTISRAPKYFIKQAEARYSYISESGSPMIGDIYFLTYPERLANLCRDLVNIIGYPNRFAISSSKIPELRHIIRNIYNENRRLNALKEIDFDATRKERTFLGNSSKPILTKQRAIDEFFAGASLDRIKEKYRGWENKPLAQWKAHVTMGTYSKIANGDEDLETIAKEEALDLLASDIPIEEIFAAYPTSFDMGQLRAYKAHIKMGTYKES